MRLGRRGGGSRHSESDRLPALTLSPKEESPGHCASIVNTFTQTVAAPRFPFFFFIQVPQKRAVSIPGRRAASRPAGRRHTSAESNQAKGKSREGMGSRVRRILRQLCVKKK